jgi:hypothetical protein
MRAARWCRSNTYTLPTVPLTGRPRAGIDARAGDLGHGEDILPVFGRVERCLLGLSWAQANDASVAARAGPERAVRRSCAQAPYFVAQPVVSRFVQRRAGA